jgi:hypothetical protein
MILAPQPSLVFDTTILENGIIKIPELNKWQNQEIHIVIVFKDKIQQKNVKSASLAGRLNKYANPELIERESEIAWSNLKDE